MLSAMKPCIGGDSNNCGFSKLENHLLFTNKLMECRLCGHPKTHKHGKMPKGNQRYYCPVCQQTFSDSFDTLYYRRQVNPEQVRVVLQSHTEGSSLRRISRITELLAYNTVVGIVRASSQQAQLIHNAQVQQVDPKVAKLHLSAT